MNSARIIAAVPKNRAAPVSFVKTPAPSEQRNVRVWHDFALAESALSLTLDDLPKPLHLGPDQRQKGGLAKLHSGKSGFSA